MTGAMDLCAVEGVLASCRAKNAARICEGAGMVRTLGKVSGGVLCGIRDVFTNLHACPDSFVVKVEP